MNYAMKKVLKILKVLFLAVSFVYLVLPLPELPPLPDSHKSTEPGDTVEIPGVSAYYTDVSRQEVLTFYRQAFSRSSFLQLPLPVIVLNHRPEYGKQAIRDTTETTFLYELVHPFRDSLYINGFDPAEDPKLKKAKDPTKIFKIKDRYYDRKIILRVMNTNIMVRLVIFFIGLFLGKVIISQLGKTLGSLWKIIKREGCHSERSKESRG
jgi:hypothetical protein